MAEKGALSNLLNRFGYGYRTQWTGLDEQGKPRGAIYSDPEAPKSEWRWNDEAQMLLPPQKTVRPGIVDELIGLPAFFGFGPQASFDAAERVGVLDEALRQESGLGPPETWPDYIAEAGGVMGAQLPVPGGQAKRGATAGAGVLRKLAKVPGAVAEWFMPTITPTPGNYAAGTAAGAVLTKYLPEVVSYFQGDEETPPDLFLEDPELTENPLRMSDVYNAVERGDLSPEEAETLIDGLLQQSGRLGSSDREGLEVAQFAKGGRIKPPTDKLALREKIAQLMSEAGEAGVEGTGREMVPVDPSLPAETPTLESLRQRIARPPEEPQGSVTRRDVLHGMASLASPIEIDPLSMISKELESVAEAAPVAVKAARSFSGPQLAHALQVISDNIYEGSEDSVEILASLAKEAAETPQFANVAPLLQQVAELERRVAFDELDYEAPEYMQGWETLRPQINQALEKVARDEGIVVVRGHEPEDYGADAIEFEERTPTLFAEPPEGGRHILDDTISSYEAMMKTEDANPADRQTLEELKKLRDYLGERADAVFAEHWMSNLGSGREYQLYDALDELGIDESIMDTIVDAAENQYVQWGSLDDWVSADPAARQKYRDLRDQLSKIAEAHPYDSPPEERALMEEYHRTWDDIFPNSMVHEDSGTAYEAEVRARQIANDLKLDDEDPNAK